MNASRLPSLIAVLAIASCTTLAAQTAARLSDGESYAVTSTAAKESGTVSMPYRHHKKLPQMFTGYAIEIAASNYPLDQANPIFRQFGNIHYEKLREGGYSYLILGKFSSKESALHFVETIIKPKTEKARLFEYKDGIRKAIRE